MKILASGDFHGKLLKKFENLVRREKIDLIISVGDYPPFHYRKLWFKHCYGKDKELWEFIGKKKYRKLVFEDLRRGEKPLKKLNEFGIPVYTVLGNLDYPSADDIMDQKNSQRRSMPNFDRKIFLVKRMKKYKNIKRFDYKALNFRNYIFIGMRGNSAPGRIKSRAFRKHKKILDDLFKKFRKENKQGRVIFCSHNIAYNTKLDILSLKSKKDATKGFHGKVAKKTQKFRHYGSKMARRIVNHYQPLLHLGGHVHESYGKQRIGKTLCINPGAAYEGHAVIIDIDETKGKINKIKFN